ncbi:hypothetical protein [Chryseolinea sp. H1M3-3]|uniref:hypothetical protein n=1 Tax=Chryseolinea sp. H1M3-3 TaxID=3034144 RepID=UPI0023EBFA86|nr:hypothetical protein [Chryseolinea sp. H1M3-3]
METTVKPGERVRSSTSRSQNEKIDQEIIANIAHYGEQSPAAIESRIKELDKKWDIERTLEVNAGLLGLAGAVLALTVDKRWAILPAVVTSFLVQHAIQGWCPPLPLFRLMGIKSRPELDREKYALKTLRNDFKGVHNAAQAWRAVNK